MKKIVLLTIAASLFALAQAQQSGFSVTAGIGSYDLRELKQYQDELIAGMPVEVKGFSMFPPYSSFRLNLFKQNESGLKYCIVYAYSNTGAHANYSDYSGFLNLNQTIKAYQLGASASYRIFNRNYFDINGYGDLRLSHVRNEVNANITTSYFYENNTLILKANTPSVEIGLDAMYHFSKITVGMEGGYLYDMGAKFKAGESSVASPAVPIKPTGELHSGMSGFRVGLKFLLWFNFEPKE